MFIALFISISKSVDSFKPFRHENTTFTCTSVCCGHSIYFFCEIVKVDLNDDGNDTFTTQKTFRENLAGTVDKDTAFNVVDMLCNIGYETFANTEAENVTVLPAITFGQIFF